MNNAKSSVFKPERGLFYVNLRKSILIALAREDKPKKWLAQELGIRQQSLTRILSKNSCSHDLLQQMAEVFSMTTSQFIALGEDGQTEKSSETI